MGKPRLEPLLSVKFLCGSCGHQFEASPARVEDDPEAEWHPYRYSAPCPECQAEAEQAWWQRNLMKAYARATGPKTPEGKAAAAANLEGHPTPEEAKRTRFNAVTNGLSARVATFFPPKPGKYPACEGCEHLATEGCREYGACLKRSELFLRTHVAFEQKSPELLQEIWSDLQSGTIALLQDMIRSVVKTGAEIKTPKVMLDPDGKPVTLTWTDPTTGRKVPVVEVMGHPLIGRISELLSRNNLSLSDLAMTPKQQEGDALLKGALDDEAEDRDSLLEYQRRQTQALEGLRGMIERSRERVSRDPVLIEHGNEEMDHGES